MEYNKVFYITLSINLYVPWYFLRHSIYCTSDLFKMFRVILQLFRAIYYYFFIQYHDVILFIRKNGHRALNYFVEIK